MRSRPLVLLVLFVLMGSFAWGYFLATSRARALRAAAGRPIEVREEAPYLVPEEHELVLTSLGSRMGTMTTIGVLVDGEEVCHATPPEPYLIEDRVPIAVVIGPGRLVKVFGGLVRGDDADAWGQLVPQAGWWSRRDSPRPDQDHR